MSWASINGDGTVNLQSTLASATADTSIYDYIQGHHHPITCVHGNLFLEDDNTMRCEHSIAFPDNIRTQAALDATIAILIFEEVNKKFR